MESKKILFVINTLGRAGAEKALLSLLNRLKKSDEFGQLKLYLYVITGQGELFDDIPEDVVILNKKYSTESVLTADGRKVLQKTCISSLFRRCNFLRLFPYVFSNLLSMIKRGNVMTDKLLWRVLAEGCDRIDEHFDLAVAYIEGGSTYYVADHINAEKKVAFVHVDYTQAGYTKKLDRECYENFDRIFSVSDQVKEIFLKTYPELESRADVFNNLIDKDRILKLSGEEEGFSDGFIGKRIITVCRLTKQKSLEYSIEAMKLIKQRRSPEALPVRWYILGEGDQREKLEKYIDQCGISEDFVLCGSYDNPYPYIKDADIYVQASKFEGRSIAIREALILGKPVIATNIGDNKELLNDGIDGLLCNLDSEDIAGMILKTIDDDDLLVKLGEAASKKELSAYDDTPKLMSVIA